MTDGLKLAQQLADIIEQSGLPAHRYRTVLKLTEDLLDDRHHARDDVEHEETMNRIGPAIERALS